MADFLSEQDAEQKIKAIIPETIKSPVIEVIKREVVSRVEHNAVFAVIFKHSKDNSLAMTNAVKKLVLDIPVGEGTKFQTPDKGKQFAYIFKEIAANVGIEAECALTLAHQPIGHAIGPALEAKEALTLLKDYSAGPNSLIEKSTDLAGMLL